MCEFYCLVLSECSSVCTTHIFIFSVSYFQYSYFQFLSSEIISFQLLFNVALAGLEFDV